MNKREKFVAIFGEMGVALSNAMIAFHQTVADRLGLHITDHKALGLLYREGPLPAGRLAEYTGLTAGSITAMIDRLERAGYVSREPDADDRRKVIVAPLPGREKEIERLFEPLENALAECLPSYTREEEEVILDFLRHAVEGLREATERLRASELSSA